MPNRLNIPEDLDSLVEKRETEDDRRQEERRADQEQANQIEAEQRFGDDRREDEDRRSDLSCNILRARRFRHRSRE